MIEIKIVAGNVEELHDKMRRLLGEFNRPVIPAPVEEKATPAAKAVEEEAAPTAADQAKPAFYRGKNAEAIAEAIKAKLVAGEDLTTDEADDLTRLPKKLQVEIEEAVKAASETNDAPATQAPDAEQAEGNIDELFGETAAPEFVLFDVDGDKLEVFDSLEKWGVGFVSHLANLDEAESVTGFARANAETARTLPPEQRATLDQAARGRIETLGSEPAAPAASAATQEDVKAAIIELNGKKGRPACEAVLQKFNATKMSEIPADKYGDFIAEARKLMEA